MAPIDPNSMMGFLLADAARLMRASFNKRAQTLGLSLAQARALTFVTKEQGLRQKDLAARLELTPMTVGKLVDTLVVAGIVERRPDPTDRRATRLYLTDSGHALLSDLWPMALATWEEAVEGLSQDKVQQFCAVLDHIKKNLAPNDS